MTSTQHKQAMDHPLPPEKGEETSITVTVKFDHNGMFISAATTGRYTVPDLDRRFWSTDALPPASLPPGEFWGPILADVGGFIGSHEDD